MIFLKWFSSKSSSIILHLNMLAQLAHHHLQYTHLNPINIWICHKPFGLNIKFRSNCFSCISSDEHIQYIRIYIYMIMIDYVCNYICKSYIYMLFPTLLVCLFIICLPPLKWSLLTRAGRRRTIPAFPGTGHLMLRESARVGSCWNSWCSHWTCAENLYVLHLSDTSKYLCATGYGMLWVCRGPLLLQCWWPNWDQDAELSTHPCSWDISAILWDSFSWEYHWFFLSFEIFLRYTWDLRFKLCCGIMGIGIIGIFMKPPPASFTIRNHFYILCFFFFGMDYQNSHAVFCKLPWDTTDSLGNVSTFSKCWSHRLYVHRRHFGCCVQAKPRSLSHLWNLHLHHTKLPDLVMTNSSPWYRWPIEIDSLPFLNMVDLSMANC